MKCFYFIPFFRLWAELSTTHSTGLCYTRRGYLSHPWSCQIYASCQLDSYLLESHVDSAFGMTSTLPRLAGRVAFVTGGGSGLGYATVERFVNQGAKVVFCDIKNKVERAKELEARLGQENALFIEADVTSVEDVNEVTAYRILGNWRTYTHKRTYTHIHPSINQLYYYCLIHRRWTWRGVISEMWTSTLIARVSASLFSRLTLKKITQKLGTIVKNYFRWVVKGGRGRWAVMLT